MRRSPLVIGPVLVVGGILWASSPGAFRANASTCDLTVLEDATGQPVPCRVHWKGAAGKPLQPPGLPFWHDHFVCKGEVALQLQPGQHSYTIERGPEYFSVTGQVTVVAGQPLRVSHRLRRLVDLAQEGWWSGETHVHRPLADIELLMRAEDLHVAPVITWWNSKGPWATAPLPAKPLVNFDDNRWYHLMGGEDERGGGALLYFNLPEPLELVGTERELPPSLKFLRAAKTAATVAAAGDRGSISVPPERDAAGAPVWAEIEKPFWWDTPVWLASGLVDSVGIAHNHMHRTGVMDNEAWGRPRDRQKYPPAWGNGLWTQDIYYQILNAGFRLPPSAGSASGVLPNPVGYNRAYVQIGGEPSYEQWWRGLRAGRVFVSNGPLLRCRANGQWPGHVFQNRGPLQVRLEARLDAREPVAAVELVGNGRVDRITLPHLVTIRESGWFLVRALGSATNTFRFASTGPWYVEIDGASPPVRREAASFFLDWVRERQSRVEAALRDSPRRGEAMQPLQEAEHFWQKKLER